MFKLLLSMLAIMAEIERDIIAERLTRGRQFAKENNQKYCRNSRIGFTQSRESKVLLENAEEVAAIWRAREMRDLGHTYQDIADQLLEEGYTPRHGKHWSTSVVYSMCNGYKKRVKVLKSDRSAQLRENYLKP